MANQKNAPKQNDNSQETNETKQEPKDTNQTVRIEVPEEFVSQIFALEATSEALQQKQDLLKDTVEELKEKVDELIAQVEVLSEEVVKKEEENENLTSAVANLSKKVTDNPETANKFDLSPISHDGKVYQPKYPKCRFEGKTVTVDDLRKDDDLISRLLAADTTMIVEIA